MNCLILNRFHKPYFKLFFIGYYKYSKENYMPYTPIKKDGTPKQKPGRKPVPKKPAVFVAGVERPHVWIIGADAGTYKHSMYHPWQMSKAQANYRGEEWALEFEDFYQLWKDDWHNRGRDPDNVCMSRLDPEGAWDADNAVIITRKEQLQRNGFQRRGLVYKPRTRKATK